MMVLRFGMPIWLLESLRALPFSEQLSVYSSPPKLSQSTVIYFFLSVIFLLTVLAFLPIGQLCGRLMERREKLKAYGLNLLGSLVGVVLMLVLSWLWTPPVAWFALCFLGTLLFYPRKPSSLLLGMALYHGGPCHSGLAGKSLVEEHLFPVSVTGIVAGQARLDGHSRGWAILPKSS